MSQSFCCALQRFHCTRYNPLDNFSSRQDFMYQSNGLSRVGYEFIQFALICGCVQLVSQMIYGLSGLSSSIDPFVNEG